MREPLLTRTFVTLSVAHFLYALAFFLFLHLPGFLLGIGAGELDVGVLFGVTSLVAILTRPPVGRIMDGRGRRPILLGGGALAACACAGYVLVSSIGPVLYGVRIVHGVAEAMLFASLFALAADIVPESRRIEGIGLFGVSGLIPMALGGALGESLVTLGGYRLLFVVGAGLNVTAVVLSLAVPEPDRQPGPPPRGVMAAVVQPSLVPLWIGGALFATALAAHFTFLKTYVLSLGGGSISYFFTTYALVAAAVRIGWGGLPERLGPTRVLGVSMTALGAGLLMLAFAKDNTALLLAGALAGAGHGYTFPILLGMVVTRAERRERGAALAIFTALFDTGTLVGGPLLGALAEHAGYPWMFGAAAGLAVSGFAALMLLDGRLLRRKMTDEAEPTKVGS